ncbi:Crp/Fnr family transcriptional regulator [Legionella maioricensis]|uniref:Cyclic nucleotide-binding domain-containing protein n=1 Tax=Legionella maioricensis TaxID=2896528 RepID=A0A9X2CZ15_9GAMM|nr:cyclic nucleotide-binding domain-containing protein [Legionella maioricensis]MCL9688047.1 cyclic nucleotide-binding domain-containing protein [Legionella maioricensis]
MIALEKLLLLKTVTLFKQTPDDLLLHIVTSIVKEKRVNAGELLLEKGGVNSTMYIVVSGRVKVHDGVRLITELAEREIFGELSALTKDPPVTSVSAITDCLLLTISSAALYELMSFDEGISKGIIQALCKRTQSMSIQVQGLLQG